MKEFELTISSPQKELFKGKAQSANIPSQEGYMSILAGHAPLLANLTKGKVSVKAQSGAKEFEITSGFADVNEQKVTLLVKQ